MLLKQIVVIGYHNVEQTMEFGLNIVISKHVRIIQSLHLLIQTVKHGYHIAQLIKMEMLAIQNVHAIIMESI
jgi:hypothetical protein